MTVHVIDRGHGAQGPERVKRFAMIGRRSGPAGKHPSTQKLHRRPRNAAGNRVPQYLRIDHGREA